MPRKAAERPVPKTKLSVTPATELVEWALVRKGAGRQFASMTHAVESGLRLLREHEEGFWVESPERKRV
jgi:hypothetical protein